MKQDLGRMGVPSVIGDLDFGDLAFDGDGPGGPVRVGVELKTAKGLVNDITTGRLAGHQVPGMQRLYPYRYLFVEGPARPGPDGLLETWDPAGEWRPTIPSMAYLDFLKYLDSLELRAGFHVKRSGGWKDTLFHIAAEYHGWHKEWGSHKSLKVFYDTTPGGVVQLYPPSLARLWAKDLPLIGWDRSEAVERHFRSPLALAQAPEEEWRSMPGIGKVIAARVWKAIRGLK